ncbi:hypothetical protein HNP65_000300 [Thermosipho japonicus]|uniref:Uncharacterized protein n=1 Tax=Thermosipho japonicus TaxID=90323 RepID=A0A841GR11_9BACT|nr:hypothetical protein [Thermosipho japonicus]MBB6061878.1 hypothetical protein [Thermosipho japonicus]
MIFSTVAQTYNSTNIRTLLSSRDTTVGAKLKAISNRDSQRNRITLSFLNRF